MNPLRKLALPLAIVVFTSSGFASEPLRNDDVVKMIKAGLAPSTVTLSIETSEAAFDLSPAALIALAEDGVSDEVIQTMIRRQSRTTAIEPIEEPSTRATKSAAAPPVLSKPSKRFDVALHSSKWARCDKGELVISGSRLRAAGCGVLDFDLPWEGMRAICYELGFRGTMLVATQKGEHRISTTTPAAMKKIRDLIRSYAPNIESNRCGNSR